MVPTAADLPAEALTVLEWWRPAVRAVLGAALVGVRLTGSAVLGGFESKWSDLDLCVVLRDPVTDDQAASLCRLHEDMERRFLRAGRGGWQSSQLIEGPYLPPRT